MHWLTWGWTRRGGEDRALTLAHPVVHQEMTITKMYVYPQTEIVSAAIELAISPVPRVSEA